MAASARDCEIGQSQPSTPRRARPPKQTRSPSVSCALAAGPDGKPNVKGVVWLNWPCGQNPGRSPKATNARWRARR
jgi:hypothetical protein